MVAEVAEALTQEGIEGRILGEPLARAGVREPEPQHGACAVVPTGIGHSSGIGDTINALILTPLAPSAAPLLIRPYDPADWPAVWALREPVFPSGKTFPHDPLPGAFRQRRLGSVNALVMVQSLGEGREP
jgi:hypothetical protein